VSIDCPKCGERLRYFCTYSHDLEDNGEIDWDSGGSIDDGCDDAFYGCGCGWTNHCLPDDEEDEDEDDEEDTPPRD
jgi:hypothetical protein